MSTLAGVWSGLHELYRYRARNYRAVAFIYIAPSLLGRCVVRRLLTTCCYCYVTMVPVLLHTTQKPGG
jgi:hypothetical protein